MVKLTSLLFEDKTRYYKFVSTIEDFVIQDEGQLTESPEKILVTKNSSGDTYEITKKWYQKHKSEYTTVSNSAPSEGDNSPKNISQFKSKYLYSANKTPSKKLLQQNKTVITSNKQYYNVIRNYTNEGYRQINRKMRNGGELTKSEQDTVNTISRAMDDCQKYQGLAVRYMAISYKNVSKMYNDNPVGSVMKSNQFLSSTYDSRTNSREKMVFDLTGSMNTKNMMTMYIGSKSGVCVQSASKHKSQKQVLFKPNCEFKIIHFDKEQNAIYLQEM